MLSNIFERDLFRHVAVDLRMRTNMRARTGNKQSITGGLIAPLTLVFAWHGKNRKNAATGLLSAFNVTSHSARSAWHGAWRMGGKVGAGIPGRTLDSVDYSVF